jgi:hypothetical protein
MANHSNEGAGLRRMIAGRRRLLLVLVAGSALFGGPQAEAAGKPAHGCPPSFDVGGLTLEEAFELPRIEAGLATEAYEEDFVESTFNKIDHNGDGLVCFQDVFWVTGQRPNPASLWQYLYNLVDNNASVG